LIEDFFLPGDATLGALAEIYGLTVAPDKAAMSLSDYFTGEFSRPVHVGDAVRIGPIALVAHTVADGGVVTVGLQLTDPEPAPAPGQRAWRRLRALWRWLRARLRR